MEMLSVVLHLLVQGSDTAMQGDVEVNDVVVRVRALQQHSAMMHASAPVIEPVCGACIACIIAECC